MSLAASTPSVIWVGVTPTPMGTLGFTAEAPPLAAAAAPGPDPAGPPPVADAAPPPAACAPWPAAPPAPSAPPAAPSVAPVSPGRPDPLTRWPRFPLAVLSLVVELQAAVSRARHVSRPAARRAGRESLTESRRWG